MTTHRFLQVHCFSHSPWTYCGEPRAQRRIEFLKWLNLHYIHPVVHQIKVYQGVPCSMPRGVNQILGTVKHVLRVSSIMSAGDMDKV